jgi:hypothetical protein
MGRQGVDFDLDEFWPPADELVALQFTSEEEFGRCRSVLWQHPDCYRTVNKWDFIVVVRKSELSLFREAELSYTPVELIEADEHPTQEDRAQQRAMMKRYMALWLHELGWDNE